MKVYPRIRRVFLRPYDGTSSYDLNPIDFILSDGTLLRINISYDSRKTRWDDKKPIWRFHPVNRNWHVSVCNMDTSMKRGRRFVFSEHINTSSSDHVRRIIQRVTLTKNRLIGLWMKKRTPVLKGFLKD